MSPGLRAGAYNGIGPSSCWLARGQPVFFLSKATHNAQVGQSRWKLLAVCEKKNTPMFMDINKDNNSIQKKKKKKKNSYCVIFSNIARL